MELQINLPTEWLEKKYEEFIATPYKPSFSVDLRRDAFIAGVEVGAKGIIDQLQNPEATDE